MNHKEKVKLIVMLNEKNVVPKQQLLHVIDLAKHGKESPHSAAKTEKKA